MLRAGVAVKAQHQRVNLLAGEAVVEGHSVSLFTRLQLWAEHKISQWELAVLPQVAVLLHQEHLGRTAVMALLLTLLELSQVRPRVLMVAVVARTLQARRQGL